MLTVIHPDHRTLFTRIESLDFSRLKMKLCLPIAKEGKGWTQEEATTAELWYKRFLKLHVLYPNDDVVPTPQIDEFWHQHILDTRAYDEDCQRIFGYKVHHYPYFGLRDDQDAQDLIDSFKRTCERFLEHFGEEPVLVNQSTVCAAGNCRSRA